MTLTKNPLFRMVKKTVGGALTYVAATLIYVSGIYLFATMFSSAI